MSKDVTAKLGKPFLGCKANRLHSNAQICALQNNFPHNSDYVIQTAVLPKYHSVAFFHRWLHTVSNASVEGQTDPWPVEIKVQKKGKVLEVAFADEQRFTFPAELLRVESPSADNRRKDQTGATRLVSGRKHVSILGVEPVGNYALRVKFDDLHENGIYTWRYLYDLGKNKYSRSKAYIKHLRERGLSREPKRR
ncbi:hypothetical protein KFL_007490050 [Klebsormidium nitens]|uniref:Gamma-butyrobetaine hydroxylase-like N-terminal domain-containing protein n=1 Tax=Klebsormidium nitens TaxID=105231 RepID=A0A1Y1IR49_KLENI|nr:hypothetical protein KFL_007490050 [Klebsormidium nitens]|eukprot:GAQ91236.1 hypothetical protein KFL_007490050 [Klebsormidium nitens]